MLIRVKKKSDVASSEITSKANYLNRRSFLGAGATMAAGAAFVPGLTERAAGLVLPSKRGRQDDELTPYEDVTTYNNYYEFGLDKGDPARYSGDFKPKPWSVEVDGLCNKPGTYALEDLLQGHDVVERTYRMRCVEAWSMVIPWQGVLLKDIISRLEPQGDAQYVRMETVVRPEEMPGQRRGVLNWPYVEGLRMDEAMNDLTLIATGLYGEDLLNQNGAPLRLVTPWKYGFKGVKSIVRISFTEEMPLNTWRESNSREYGFYANVNPEVDHPRWTQARERRIGELRRRPTLMFNGYEEEVAHMYAGMDLARWY